MSSSALVQRALVKKHSSFTSSSVRSSFTSSDPSQIPYAGRSRRLLLLAAEQDNYDDDDLDVSDLLASSSQPVPYPIGGLVPTADTESRINLGAAFVSRVREQEGGAAPGDSEMGGDQDSGDGDAWEQSIPHAITPYVSRAFRTVYERSRDRPERIQKLLADLIAAPDPLWFQVKLEAQEALRVEPQSGPTLYSNILSQPNLLTAVVEHVANIVASPTSGFRFVMEPTAAKNLFMKELTPSDLHAISADIIATATRSPSSGDALTATLFNPGIHALVSYRLSHRLWLQGRKGVAHLIQSRVSSAFACDIHPAAQIGAGTYLAAGNGVVIGETAVVKDDVTILQGVTLGGTGKVRGDRHPKIGNGVILQDGCAVLGNIEVSDGAVVMAKSIALKPVESMARVSGVPAKVKSHRPPLPAEPELFSSDHDDYLSYEQKEQIISSYSTWRESFWNAA
ncbi:hypothetical protein TrST_g2345 [Triparma strigata]|uniref:Serine acetyltransferase N-terminal domain-containing protein n=1 Tax=Triparma strigata TaxID=1606541 RepID=A0A9W6ZXJ9_9STRA|nr:hypothetical protein TrST_g2345 [Triparma strigata]